MKGWFVDKDTGKPIAHTHREHKPNLEAAGHPFITDRIPEGLHAPQIGRFAKWTVSGWVRDADAEQAWEDRRERTRTIKEEAKQAFLDLTNFDAAAVDWSVPAQIRAAFEYKRIRDLKIARYLASL